MPPSREPWIKVKIRLDESDKVAGLPNDAARWGWVRVLLKAKTQRRMGVFGSRQQLKTILGIHGRFVPSYLAAGLLHEWPTDCRCAPAYEADTEDGGEVPDGALVVHDYRDEQIQPNAQIFADPEASPGARRTKLWRLRTAVFERDSFTCRYCGNAEYERRWLVADHVVPPEKGGSDALDNLVTACRPCNKRKGGRTPREAGMPLRDVSQASPGDVSQPDGDASPRPVTSRARGTTGTRTGRISRSSQGEQQPGSTGPARAPGAAVHPGSRSNGQGNAEAIARARAKLADPSTSPALREVAVAQLNRMGVPLDPDELDFGEAGR